MGAEAPTQKYRLHKNSKPLYARTRMYVTHCILIALLAYSLGSIPFGVVLAKLFRLPDPRTIGSGNIGATNMLRTGNKKIALLTLLLDAGKGIAAVVLTAKFISPAISDLAFATLLAPLTRADFEAIAARLGCEWEAAAAVAEVESGTLGGFTAEGKPVILFERQHLHCAARTIDADRHERRQIAGGAHD